MNAASFASVLTFLACTIAAGVGAGLHGAGWAAVIFALAGAFIGFVGALGVSRAAYAILGMKAQRPMMQAAVLAAYLVVPILLGSIAAMAVGKASALIAAKIAFHEKPNKAPEPTRGAVTIRADARLAPAPRVAHL